MTPTITLADATETVRTFLRGYALCELRPEQGYYEASEGWIVIVGTPCPQRTAEKRRLRFVVDDTTGKIKGYTPPGGPGEVLESAHWRGSGERPLETSANTACAACSGKAPRGSYSLGKEPMRESTLTRRILDYLNSLEGCYARKTWGGPFSSAWPDIIACYKGRMLAIEDKTRRNRPSALQAAELRKWQQAGATALVARSLEDVMDVLK